jgi:hypothetical protein
VQATGAGAYFFVRELGAFYAVAALFGLAYAGVMLLYAVIARENFPMHVMGTVFGAAAMACFRWLVLSCPIVVFSCRIRHRILATTPTRAATRPGRPA